MTHYTQWEGEAMSWKHYWGCLTSHFAWRQAIMEAQEDAYYAHFGQDPDDDDTWDGVPRWRRAWHYVLAAYYMLTPGWVWVVRFRIAAAVCARWGHKLEDAGSYANPEHGADHIRCRRCGEYWTHHYY